MGRVQGPVCLHCRAIRRKSGIECSISIASAAYSGNKKGVQADASWQKVKFDHQIVAIAKANSATMIYSEDHGLRKFAASQGLAAQCTNDLPENPESKQQTLDLTVSADSAKPN